MDISKCLIFLCVEIIKSIFFNYLSVFNVDETNRNTKLLQFLIHLYGIMLLVTTQNAERDLINFLKV